MNIIPQLGAAAGAIGRVESGTFLNIRSVGYGSTELDHLVGHRIDEIPAVMMAVTQQRAVCHPTRESLRTDCPTIPVEFFPADERIRGAQVVVPLVTAKAYVRLRLQRRPRALIVAGLGPRHDVIVGSSPRSDGHAAACLLGFAAIPFAGRDRYK